MWVFTIFCWATTSSDGHLNLLAIDVGCDVFCGFHAWSFALALYPDDANVGVQPANRVYHQFASVAVVSCTPANVDNKLFPSYGDLLVFFVDRGNLKPRIEPIHRAHLEDVMEALDTYGPFIRGSEESFGCAASPDGERYLLSVISDFALFLKSHEFFTGRKNFSDTVCFRPDGQLRRVPLP